MESAWNRLLMDTPLRVARFEKEEVQFPCLPGSDFLRWQHAAILNVGDWPQEAQSKFLQAWFYGTYFADPSGLFLEIMEPCPPKTLIDRPKKYVSDAEGSAVSCQPRQLPNADPTPSGLTILTLWRTGWSDAQAAVLSWLVAEPLPEGTKMVWTAPRDSETRRALEKIIEKWPEKGCRVEIVDVEGVAPESRQEKHRLVAGLYSREIARITTPRVCFVEDDTVPACGDLSLLMESLEKRGPDTAGVMGAYRSRVKCGAICASRAGQYYPWDQSGKNRMLEADWIGGGFTVYRTAALQICLPLEPEIRGNAIQGWDVIVCRQLRQRGWLLFVNTAIRVAHRCPEVEAWCLNHGQPVC